MSICCANHQEVPHDVHTGWLTLRFRYAKGLLQGALKQHSSTYITGASNRSILPVLMYTVCFYSCHFQLRTTDIFCVFPVVGWDISGNWQEYNRCV